MPLIGLTPYIRSTAPVCYWTCQDAAYGVLDRDGSVPGIDELDFLTNNPDATTRPLLQQASIIPSRPAGYSIYFDGVNDYAKVSLDAGGGTLRLAQHWIFFFKVGADWPTCSLYRHNPRGATGFGLGHTITLHGSADPAHHGRIQFVKGIGGSGISRS